MELEDGDYSLFLTLNQDIKKLEFQMDSTADIFIHMMRSLIENGMIYLRFMNTAFEGSQAAFAIDDRDENLNEIYNKLSQRWLELYQQSVGKYLAAPQFGIQREALQQFKASIAAYHRFMGAGGDFLVKFSKPLNKSMDMLQQALQDGQYTKNGANNAKNVYNLALSILDKEYDDWLKSPEGVQSVAGMVNRYLEYRQSLNPVRDNWLKSLAVPTKIEMADVYKGIYELRKTSRQQEAVIQEQKGAIEKLNVKIRKLEDALAKSTPNKKRAQARKTKPNKKRKSVSK